MFSNSKSSMCYEKCIKYIYEFSIYKHRHSFQQEAQQYQKAKKVKQNQKWYYYTIISRLYLVLIFFVRTSTHETWYYYERLAQKCHARIVLHANILALQSRDWHLRTGFRLCSLGESRSRIRRCGPQIALRHLRPSTNSQPVILGSQTTTFPATFQV